MQYLALGVMREYRHKKENGGVTKVASFHDAKGTLDAVYASLLNHSSRSRRLPL